MISLVVILFSALITACASIAPTPIVIPQTPIVSTVFMPGYKQAPSKRIPTSVWEKALTIRQPLVVLFEPDFVQARNDQHNWVVYSTCPPEEVKLGCMLLRANGKQGEQYVYAPRGVPIWAWYSRGKNIEILFKTVIGNESISFIFVNVTAPTSTPTLPLPPPSDLQLPSILPITGDSNK